MTFTSDMSVLNTWMHWKLHSNVFGSERSKKTKSIEIFRYKMETSPKEMIDGTHESNDDHKKFKQVIKGVI